MGHSNAGSEPDTTEEVLLPPRSPVGLSARVDRYNILVARYRRAFLIAVIALTGWAGSTALNVQQYRNRFEVRTGYFLLTDEGLRALGPSHSVQRTDPSVIKGFLELFVTEAFRVGVDLDEQLEYQQLSLYRTMGTARRRLNEFLLTRRNPYTLIPQGETVEVDRPSIRILPQPEEGGNPNIWHVQLEESHRTSRNLAVEKTEVRLTVQLDFKGDERTWREGEEEYRNLFGIWIKALHMERYPIKEEEDQDP